ncbi:MAG: serine/threonine protein kinase [Gemmatimonadetes bacterium]|nr:serine/threonine protein kinase [Gemmatimonadota bacterium]
MPDTAQIRAAEPAATFPTPGERSGWSALPDDLIQDASRRLGLACLLYGGVWALHLLVNNLVAPASTGRPLDPAWPMPGNAVAVGIMIVSLLVFAYTRHRSADPRTALDLGLVYQVVLAFGIGMVDQWVPRTEPVPWIPVLLVVHPVIVPNTRAKTLIASLITASMDPIGVAIAGARGVPTPPPLAVMWASLPNLICAFAALLPSTVIRRLGGQVARARDLGSYQIGELLGRGGMGEIYRAKHRMLRRPAAIKLIRPDAAGAASGAAGEIMIRRFRKEAQAAATLHSPHSIALYDFGLTAEGAFYYVMELLHGVDCDSLVQRFGPVPAARMVYLLRQACHSLAEAHGAGLIHRDIKPANIFVCRLGTETDFVKVLDFGLVKSLRPSGADQSVATAPGVAMGTPAFMAPEVAVGQPDLDHRVDIYALGCVAYWLLTGRLVFEADSLAKIMYAHLADTPRPPSTRTELPVPPAVDELVLRCLSKEREGRPADALELARLLGQCDVGEPWTGEAAAQWWQTHLPEHLSDVPAVEPRWSASVKTLVVQP